MLLYEMMALPDLSRVGSILMMLIFISVLIIAHEMGHFLVARRCGIKVERFGFGLPFGPTLWSKKVGEVEYCIHACLFGGYVAFPDDDPENPLPQDSPERFENQPIGSRLAVMLAGVTVNAILGWVLMFFVFMTWGYPTGDAEKKVLVGGVLNNSAPAAQAGVQKGDQILQVNHVTVDGKDYLAMMTQVKDLFKANSNHAVPLLVQRQGHPTTLQIKPNAEGKVGIQLAAIQKYDRLSGPVEGAQKTSSFLGNVIQKQFESFGKLFTGQMALKELAGPIRIVDEGANMINQNGVQTGLMLTAIISVILAVMNLLPIPALDGGHVFFLLIEAIKGSPVNQAFREKVTQFGFLGMLALIGFILINDINNTFINPLK
jgi:membrane-associated protease RseP (regulator of RpoE activity)